MRKIIILLFVCVSFTCFADEYYLKSNTYNLEVIKNLPDDINQYFDIKRLAEKVDKSPYNNLLPEKNNKEKINLIINIAYINDSLDISINQKNFKYIDTGDISRNVFIESDYGVKPIINLGAFQDKANTITDWIQEMTNNMPENVIEKIWIMPVYYYYRLTKNNGDSISIMMKKMPGFGKPTLIQLPLSAYISGEFIDIYLRDNNADNWIQELLTRNSFVLDDRRNPLTGKLTTTKYIYSFFKEN